MTKSELIDEMVSQMRGISKEDMEIIVNTMFDTMTLSLSRHERIEIRGFGSFTAKEREARAARNPRTGQKVDVPKKKVPFFALGKELRERINQV